MQKLAAVSEKHAAPVILAWTASAIMKEIAQLIKSDPSSLSTFYPHLVTLAKKVAARSGTLSASTAKTESELVAWLLMPTRSHISWDQLLQMPCMEQLLDAACKFNTKVTLACDVLGIRRPHLMDSSLQGSQSHMASILGQLHDSSLKKLVLFMDGGTSKPQQVPLNVIAASLAKLTGSQAPPSPCPATAPHSDEGGLTAVDDTQPTSTVLSEATPTAVYDPNVNEAVVGLALYRWMSIQLGLELNPDFQLVNRLLHTSPFEVMLSQRLEKRNESAIGANEFISTALSDLSHDLLQNTVKHLAALPGISATALLSELDSPGVTKTFEAAIAVAASGGDMEDLNSCRTVLHAVRTWRRAALLLGVPCVMATASGMELDALSTDELLRVQSAAQRLETSWRLLQGLVKPGYDGRLGLELDHVGSTSSTKSSE
jgi:hypothetical protein